MKIKTSNFYHIGLYIAASSVHASSVCVSDSNKNIVLLDKLYFSDDIKLFLETSPFVKNSVIMAAITPDESLLEGKWRIHSKNYKQIEGMFDINKNDWTKRLNERLCDFLFYINNEKAKVYRCNTSLLRQSYGLRADYPENSSLDCKNFQAGLKMKYGFNSLPENLLPSASLIAVLCSLFACDICKNGLEYKEIADFCGLKVINPAHVLCKDNFAGLNCAG